MVATGVGVGHKEFCDDTHVELRPLGRCCGLRDILWNIKPV